MSLRRRLPLSLPPLCHKPTYAVQQKPLLNDLVGAAVAWRVAARAQQLAAPVIGFLQLRIA